MNLSEIWILSSNQLLVLKLKNTLASVFSYFLAKETYVFSRVEVQRLISNCHHEAFQQAGELITPSLLSILTSSKRITCLLMYGLFGVVLRREKDRANSTHLTQISRQVKQRTLPRPRGGWKEVSERILSGSETLILISIERTTVSRATKGVD